MSESKKGYAGQSGHFSPAAQCHIPRGAVANLITGKRIERQWTAEDVSFHFHIRNIDFVGGGTAATCVTFGEYQNTVCLQFSMYSFSDSLHFVITTKHRASSTAGKYYTLECRNVGGYPDGYIRDEGFQKVYTCKPIPNEVEVFYEKGEIRFICDGVLIFSLNDVLDGDFSVGDGSNWPLRPRIIYNPNISYELVDFTYKTSETSCRFVPMKTVDGKDAIYEVHSQKVVEI